MQLEQIHTAAYSTLACIHVATGIAHGALTDFAIAALYGAMGSGAWVVARARHKREPTAEANSATPDGTSSCYTASADARNEVGV